MEAPKQSTWHKTKVLFLGDEAKSKEETKLVRKLDRAAFANAYVAGLREELDLDGNQYSILLSLATVGYTIGQIPHGIVIQKIAPRIWLPSCVLVWAGLTMATAACKNFAQLAAIRFLLGLVEASTYCGTIYIIGSWYKPREIAKRTAIFTASGQAGTMFAGIMMTAIHRGMDGLAGLAGWKWVFIIDGIITCPIAIFGYLWFPDTPETTKAPFFRPSEKQLALDRLPPKKADGHNINPWSLAKRVFGSPAFYILCSFSFVCAALEAYCIQNCFLLFLKYYNQHFTQTEVNTFPLGIQGVSIVANLLASVYIDATGKRVPMGVLACALQAVSVVLLMIPNISFAGTFVGFYLSGTAYIVNPLLFGWANIICQRGGDDALRSVTLFAMNTTANILYTFWGIAFYNASDAPYWRKGGIAMSCIIVLLLSMLWVVHWLDNWTAKKYPEISVLEAIRLDLVDKEAPMAPSDKKLSMEASVDKVKN
ncbi:Pantothenate transporter liz1 [Daldinia childiae]|uniref:Pantothenate transporter liz1 n=1 Tax=Daldinia childiae TaxID=326645 RepID=UPI001444F00D|nr:Pantothenate transporter liz1 [Daldinia childiae]KAF3062068.1 Pantothenate transporter liz1 [Daldinia childiae]